MRLGTYSVDGGAPRLGADCGRAVLDLDRYSHLHDGLRLPADMLELLRHPLIGGHDLVEGVGDLAGQAYLVAGHAHRKVPDPHRLQGTQKIVHRKIGAAVRRRLPVLFRHHARLNRGIYLASGLTGGLHASLPGKTNDEEVFGGAALRREGVLR